MNAAAHDLENLKYPIGRYIKPALITADALINYISDIEKFPSELKAETAHLINEQLDTPYRPGGWTIRQVVHHCADSHMNALTRHKLALTEDKPAIKPYREKLWAELPDTKTMPISSGLQLLEALHYRWITLLKTFGEAELKKGFIHPEHGREILLEESIGMYAWHCKHHLAHITSLKKDKGWK